MPALRAVLVGLGHRTACYAAYARQHPDELTVVGLADPDEQRLARFADKWSVPPEACFASGEELAAAPKFADVAINGTMDGEHVATTIPLVEAGYDVLLEKPIAPSAAELERLAAAVGNSSAKVVICHVLRYAPFYAAIKERLVAGDIGDIMHMHTTENVSYHHMAVAFVRGKWNRREVNPMLLAKCCHDLDLLCWFKSGTPPTKVASFGGRHFFTPENAPEGAGTNCVTDCDIERECQYSARRHHVDNDWWPFYAFAGEPGWEGRDDEDAQEQGDQVKLDWLAQSAYSHCVWGADNDVVDRQSVIVEFADGCVATHDMVSNAARATRRLHLVGSGGEIDGDLEDGRFTIRVPAATEGEEWTEEVVEVEVKGDMHGGGDLRLVADFLAVVRGEQPSLSTTHLSDSLNGHEIAYAADAALRSGTVIDIDARG
jgi:predicted dehydrogenase